MQAYGINYSIDGKEYDILIDAKDVKSAKNKIGRKHGLKTGRKVKISKVSVVGYY